MTYIEYTCDCRSCEAQGEESRFYWDKYWSEPECPKCGSFDIRMRLEV